MCGAPLPPDGDPGGRQPLHRDAPQRGGRADLAHGPLRTGRPGRTTEPNATATHPSHGKPNHLGFEALPKNPDWVRGIFRRSTPTNRLRFFVGMRLEHSSGKEVPQPLPAMFLLASRAPPPTFVASPLPRPTGVRAPSGYSTAKRGRQGSRRIGNETATLPGYGHGSTPTLVSKMIRWLVSVGRKER